MEIELKNSYQNMMKKIEMGHETLFLSFKLGFMF